MAHKISEECIACGSCIDQCPVEAIHEGDPHYSIDADTCVQTAAPAPRSCPVNAIAPE
ncbi:MAG: 4Fe-4S binding protein [Planctomycetota bacterium]|nr:4Fe-4S binding protein [Planctomycetota bacterium]